MVEPQPSIEIFGILINEPVTTLTDLLAAGVCFFAFFRLNRIPEHNKVHKYLKYYFLSMAIALTIGGIIGHGFFYLFTFHWKLPGWLTSMVSVALCERAAIEYARQIINPKLGRFFAWLNLIELLTFITLTFITLNFFFVEVHSAYGLLIVVAGFNLYVYRKTKSRGSKLFLIAVGFSAIAALFYMNEWAPHILFNHSDVSHCFMAVSAWFFYKGAMEEINQPIEIETT